MRYEIYERIRNLAAFVGVTLVGYDLLKYVVYVGDSLEEEVLRFVGWLFICGIASRGGRRVSKWKWQTGSVCYTDIP